LRVFIFIFLIALAVTGFSTPWMRRFSVWIGFVDAPGSRKLHVAPMPLMGGVAIFAGAMLALLLLAPDLPASIQAPQVSGLLLAGTLVAALGLLDDRVALPPWAKLAGQLLATTVLVAFDIRVKLPLPEALNYMITFLWVLGITNAFNFLDNMDGLTAGASAVSSSFLLLSAAQNNQYLVAGLAAALLGACLGFLRYNFNPATIFMGDSGALFLGFLLAVLGIQLRFPANSPTITWMVPIFLMGLPIFDTTLVVFSRLRRGARPWQAGKDHLSHRLVNMGCTQREAVLILYLVSGALGMVGLFIAGSSLLEAGAISATMAIVAVAAIIWLERRHLRAA
jgi:UDP-GlcNAc:undecaprenyl-phosphate GlcNAc-1-phosphate transferase